MPRTDDAGPQPEGSRGPRAVRLLRSTTLRFALLYAILFGVSVLMLLGFIYWSTAAYMTRQTNATIAAEIAGLRERYESDGLAGLTAVIAERVARQRPTSSAVYLLTDPGLGRIVGNLDRWPTGAAETGGWLVFGLHNATSAPSGSHPARARAFVLTGGFRLLVGRDMQDLESARALMVNTLGWGLGITVVLALAGGVMMSRGVARRIEIINATSREIMSGDLSRRIPLRGSGDDFDELAASLNAMLDQIQDLMEGIRRVSDNIAHDLRTPLARLRGRLEDLRGGGDGSTFSARREAVELAIAEADGLLATFSALLRIARIEDEGGRSAFRDVDLDELCRDVAELYEPLAEERRQHLIRETGPPGSAVVKGDRDLLFQAVANLVDNALKYTPAEGTIRITVLATPAGPRAVVADTGPGIPAEFRDRVFQRFYRLESSRSTPGNGLGLSLVAAVARLHGAEVKLEDTGCGLCVVLAFPARDVIG